MSNGSNIGKAICESELAELYPLSYSCRLAMCNFKLYMPYHEYALELYWMLELVTNSDDPEDFMPIKDIGKFLSTIRETLFLAHEVLEQCEQWQEDGLDMGKPFS